MFVLAGRQSGAASSLTAKSKLKALPAAKTAGRNSFESSAAQAGNLDKNTVA
jgi:hypothetical protein